MRDRRLLVIAEIGCGPCCMGNRMRMRALLEVEAEEVLAVSRELVAKARARKAVGW
jgi:hypothetical protein